MGMSRHILSLTLLAILLSSLTVNAASITDKRNAKKLYERLTGVKVNSSKPILEEVAKLLAEGQNTEAVRRITASPDFLNVQIKNLALRLSNKDESVKVNFSDFAAIVVGTVRDNRDFRQILTGSYTYEVVAPNISTDDRTRQFAQTMYSPVEMGFVNLVAALTYRPTQKVAISGINNGLKAEYTSAGGIVSEVDNPDTAGVLSTRTFAERNLSGGTNRRAVEFSLKQFLCVSLAEAADANASDQYVGKDVERFPAGDHNKYLTSCKSCHAVMDGMRPAFAKLEYSRYSSAAGPLSYSLMNGDVYNSQSLDSERTKYLNDVVAPIRAEIITDLERRQLASTYYTTVHKYLMDLGSTAAEATATLLKTVDTIRDTTVLENLVAKFRLENVPSLTRVRDNRTLSAYVTLYSETCLAHFGNTSITAAMQETRFLNCDFTRRGKSSFIYGYYRSELMANRVTPTGITKLLAKLMNEGRQSNSNIIEIYLQATKKSRVYPTNGFESSGVATKLNKGSYTYGFTVTNDRFVNNANLGNKSAFFGWRGSNKDGGSGLKEFGRMIADSKRFSQCVAKRAYESVCLKKLDNTHMATLSRLGDRFEALNYNIKNFYGEVALESGCGILQKEPAL